MRHRRAQMLPLVYLFPRPQTLGLTGDRLQFDTSPIAEATQKSYGPISIYERVFLP